MNVYEFLFRGKRPLEDNEPGWHVVLAQEVDTDFGKQAQISNALSVSQAAELGVDLTKIVEGINDEALKEVERLREELEVARVEAALSNSLVNAIYTAYEQRPWFVKLLWSLKLRAPDQS